MTFLPEVLCGRCGQPCTGPGWSAPFNGHDFTPTHDTCPTTTKEPLQ